jgi:hypothetical protein
MSAAAAALAYAQELALAPSLDTSAAAATASGSPAGFAAPADVDYADAAAAPMWAPDGTCAQAEFYAPVWAALARDRGVACDNLVGVPERHPAVWSAQLRGPPPPGAPRAGSSSRSLWVHAEQHVDGHDGMTMYSTWYIRCSGTKHVPSRGLWWCMPRTGLPQGTGC